MDSCWIEEKEMNYLNDVIIVESRVFLTEQSVDDGEQNSRSCFSVDSFHTLHKEFERVVDVWITGTGWILQRRTQLRITFTTRSCRYESTI